MSSFINLLKRLSNFYQNIYFVLNLKFKFYRKGFRSIRLELNTTKQPFFV